MTDYQVTWVDRHGAVRVGRVAALSEQAAGASLHPQLSRDGGVVLSISQLQISPLQFTPLQIAQLHRHVLATLWSRLSHGSKVPSRIDEASFASDLASMLVAGVQATEALQSLAACEASPARKALIADMVERLRQGRSLSSAMEASGAFSGVLIATIAASEHTGDVDAALVRFSQQQRNLQRIRDQVIAACVYPALLIAVTLVVLAVLMGLVVPRFSALLDLGTGQLPLLSRMLMAWGVWASANPWAAAAIIGAGLAAPVVLAIQLAEPERRKRWLAALPVVGPLARELQHLQLYRTTSILTARGVPIHRAVQHGEQFLSPADRQRLRQAVTSMQQGQRISDAMAASGFSDAIATSMLAVAERSGSLADMLERIADLYERRLGRHIELASRLIEPILMVLLGLLVGGLVILMYIPLFDLASSISS